LKNGRKRHKKPSETSNSARKVGGFLSSKHDCGLKRSQRSNPCRISPWKMGQTMGIQEFQLPGKSCKDFLSTPVPQFPRCEKEKMYTIWLFNIAMENHHF
jgi:hypothetical protein